ncbi:hypothetical protein N7534_009476 [Penicillium rubens]|nr:hypothetical protein N7534_009476 [Penicillium rubens]
MALPLHRNQNSQTWGGPKEKPYWHFRAYGSRQSRHIGQEQSYGEAIWIEPSLNVAIAVKVYLTHPKSPTTDPHAWLWYRMALVSAASSSSVVGLTNNRCGRSKRINQMRAQVEVLEQQEQQLRGTEARIRDSVRDYLLPVLPRPLQLG